MSVAMVSCIQLLCLNHMSVVRVSFMQLICRQKIQLDATQWIIELIIRSTCFGHCYAHHQELESIKVITACGT